MPITLTRAAMLSMLLAIVLAASLFGFLYAALRQPPARQTTSSSSLTSSVGTPFNGSTTVETTYVTEITFVTQNVTVITTTTVTIGPTNSTGSASSTSSTSSTTTSTSRSTVGSSSSETSTTISSTKTTSTTSATSTSSTAFKDFELLAPRSMTVAVGGANASFVYVVSENGFSSQVSLQVLRVDSNLSTTLDPSVVTPPPNGRANSTLAVVLEPFVTPREFDFSVQGTSGSLVHSSEVRLHVLSTTTGMTTVVNDLVDFGCINSTSVAKELVEDLAAVQKALDSGNEAKALRILAEFNNLVKAQNGVGIAKSCTADGVTFSPEDVLLDDSHSLSTSIEGRAPLDLGVLGYELSNIWNQHQTTIEEAFLFSPLAIMLGIGVFLVLKHRDGVRRK